MRITVPGSELPPSREERQAKRVDRAAVNYWHRAPATLSRPERELQAALDRLEALNSEGRA